MSTFVQVADLINGGIALLVAWVVALSALKTRRNKSTGGVHHAQVWGFLLLNVWFALFYGMTGFPVAMTLEFVCIASYAWWLVEFLRVEWRKS